MYKHFFFYTAQNSGGRFEILSKIKFEYRFEKYLLLDNRLRKMITSLRLSTHILPIEDLRKKKVERKNRTCNCCNSGEIGSEFHVLMACQCIELKRERNRLNLKLSQLCSQWPSLSNKDKLQYLLCAHDPQFSFYFAIFLEKIFKFVGSKNSKN